MQLGKLFNALALGGAPAQARAIAPSIGEMIAVTVRGKPYSARARCARS
jgi:hypothetical protein